MDSTGKAAKRQKTARDDCRYAYWDPELEQAFRVDTDDTKEFATGIDDSGAPEEAAKATFRDGSKVDISGLTVQAYKMRKAAAVQASSRAFPWVGEKGGKKIYLTTKADRDPILALVEGGRMLCSVRKSSVGGHDRAMAIMVPLAERYCSCELGLAELKAAKIMATKEAKAALASGPARRTIRKRPAAAIVEDDMGGDGNDEEEEDDDEKGEPEPEDDEKGEPEPERANEPARTSPTEAASDASSGEWPAMPAGLFDSRMA